MKNFARPHNVRILRGWLSLRNYFWRFIEDYATLAEPLTRLTTKDCPFVWSDLQECSFDEPKKTLTSPPILAHSDPSLPIKIHTGGSAVGVAAILVQKTERVKQEAYASKAPNAAQKNHGATELELYAVISCCGKNQILFVNQRNVQNYYRPFRNKQCVKNLNSNGTCSQMDFEAESVFFEVVYRPGKRSTLSDALSTSQWIQRQNLSRNFTACPLFFFLEPDIMKLEQEKSYGYH